MVDNRRDTQLGLGGFLETLENRLRTLATEEIVAALLAHAKRLPAGSRQGFLDIFPDPGTAPSTPAQFEDHLLLTDIDAFVERAHAGDFDAEEEWDDDPFDNNYWDESRADASWVEEAEDLFAGAGEAFLADRLDLAREAYGRLFGLFKPAHQGGSGLDAWHMRDTDLDEAVARYLRSLYETTPPDQRGPALYQEYTSLSLVARRLRLRDIATARRGDLPDLEVFLPAWIDALLADTSALPPQRRRQLLTEATLLHRGVDGLADLARLPGSHQPGTYLDWIDALAAEGRLREAADAAREALVSAYAGHAGSDASHAGGPATAGALAQAADRLAELTAGLGDLGAAVEARCRAWRTEPTRQRLLALVAASEAANTLTETLAAEVRNAKDGNDRLTCELLLLAGEVGAASAVLTRAGPLGWSQPDHPGPVVLPYLLVAATATAPPPREETQLGQDFADIDVRLPSYPDPEFDIAGEDEDEEVGYGAKPGDNTDGGPAGTAGTPAPLTALLTRRIIESTAPERQRRQWLATAATVVERRVDAIVGNKHRSAYERAASLVVAYAETLTITGTASGHDYVASVRQRYPRHTAFRSELDDATYASTLLTDAGASASARSRRRSRRSSPS